jgi:protoporphyrinogen oxidase
MMSYPVVVIGAGPAGLTAAYELVKLETPVLVLEKDNQVGGISRTETYKGYRFDIGGHRFYTKVSEVEELWHEVLGSDFIEVDRLSRIYYGGKFYHYPIRLWNTLYNLGPIESVRVLVSYLKAKARTPFPKEASLEEWVINRFGERLYKMFFKTYTEKVWGIPCSEIRADWAAQRIKDLSLKRAVVNAFTKRSDATSLIERFRYPIHGPGMMWERFRQRVEDEGGDVRLDSSVESVHHDDKRVTHVSVQTPEGHVKIAADHFVTSMPITQLITRLSPAPPDHVVEAAKGLSYRDFIVVALICDSAHLFPDNWIYVHSPDVQVGRIQNFKNWSVEMVPDASKTCLGMEYFCTLGDDLWNLSDAELQKLATRELVQIGLAREDEIVDGVVMRQRMAYPVYDEKYKQHLQVLRKYLDGFQNLSTVGRAGMHRYNNQDHSMLTAMLAVRNIMGEEHDLWDVNVERSYHEQFTLSEAKAAKAVRLIATAA